MKALAGITLALLVVITATSAYLRLTQAGFDCADRVECYGRVVPAPEPGEESAGVTVARGLHRIAASVVGVLVLVIALTGWNRFRRGERIASVALVVLAAVLAWLGRSTPSLLPAVTLGNLLGGFAMIGVAAWLAASLSIGGAPGTAPPRSWLWIALGIVALASAVGGMVAARRAGLACSLAECARWPSDIRAGAFNLLVATNPPADAADLTESARQALNMAHRWLAIPVVLVIAWIGARTAMLGRRASGVALIVLAFAQVGIGLAQVALRLPLWLSFAHILIAAAILGILAAALAGAGGEQR